MFPLAPEYIGYEDVGLTPDMFISVRPSIEILEQRMFKYRVDFKALQVGDEVAAMCVSRPTNPTGNVLTDEEIAHLRSIARARGIPLIIDNAYGTPFPDIIFSQATPVWDEEMIVCTSLSKLGLPGTRNGIVVASEEVCRVLSGMNAIISLANNGLGGALVKDMLDSGDIMRISRDCIKPFYQEKGLFSSGCGLRGCRWIVRPSITVSSSGVFWLYRDTISSRACRKTGYIAVNVCASPIRRMRRWCVAGLPLLRKK
jgi:valine--pyruvate aminotransferase